MSTKPSFPIASTSGRTPIRAKMIIAAAVVILVVLYAEGVTLMIDAADKPGPYTTFLHRAD